MASIIYTAQIEKVQKAQIAYVVNESTSEVEYEIEFSPYTSRSEIIDELFKFKKIPQDRINFSHPESPPSTFTTGVKNLSLVETRESLSEARPAPLSFTDAPFVGSNSTTLGSDPDKTFAAVRGNEYNVADISTDQEDLDPPLRYEEHYEENPVSGDFEYYEIDREGEQAGSGLIPSAKKSRGLEEDPESEYKEVGKGSRNPRKVDQATLNRLKDSPESGPIKKSKRSVQLEGLGKGKKRILEQSQQKEHLQNVGVLGDHLVEPVPNFIKMDYEKVISNSNNAWIVLGRDRPADRKSGFAGKGHTQAGSIDICVGRMSPYCIEEDADGERIYCDPIFNTKRLKNKGLVTDAARIYISQKTNIDKNFNIVEGKVGGRKKGENARSAIGIKADAVRIIGRQGIKLVTRCDPINSQGGKIKKIRGIDIIAGNDDRNMHPMVLGDNMRACMDETLNAIDKVIGTLQSVILNISALDAALSSHFHVQTWPPGLPTLPSPTALPACLASLASLASVDTFSTWAEKWDVGTIKGKYLKSGAPSSIVSSFNHVN